MSDADTPTRLGSELTAATEVWARQTLIVVAVDFDGTLASFTPNPMEARSSPSADAALRRLARDPGTQIALVSGRPVRDLALLASPPPGTELIGSHGAEYSTMSNSGPGPIVVQGAIDNAEEVLAAVHADLEAIAAAHPGTWLEIKPFARAIHTRGADRHAADAATEAALAGPARRDRVHVLPGKEVVEIAVVQADKGEALTAMLARIGARERGVAFLGDDVTDEHAFAVIPPMPGGISIKVGPEPTRAAYRLTGQSEVGIWLEFVAGLRGV